MSPLGVSTLGKILPHRINIKITTIFLSIKNITSTERINLRIKGYFSQIIFLSILFIYQTLCTTRSLKQCLRIVTDYVVKKAEF